MVFFPSLSHTLSLSPSFSFFLSPLCPSLCDSCGSADRLLRHTKFPSPSTGLPRLQTPSDALRFSYWVQKCAISERDVHPKEEKKKKERKENQNPLKKIQRGDLRLLSARLIFRHTSFKTLKSHTSRTCGVFEGKRFQSSSR